MRELARGVLDCGGKAEAATPLSRAGKTTGLGGLLARTKAAWRSASRRSPRRRSDPGSNPRRFAAQDLAGVRYRKTVRTAKCFYFAAGFSDADRNKMHSSESAPASAPESFGWGAVWWMSFPGWLVPAFGVGFVSYYGFEKPFLKLRARWRKT